MKLKYVPGGICAPTGFTAGATHCGVRPNKKKNDRFFTNFCGIKIEIND